MHVKHSGFQIFFVVWDLNPNLFADIEVLLGSENGSVIEWPDQGLGTQQLS